MPTLEGRVAVVTGGGRGIGAATAVALAEAGASVAVAARSRDQLEAVAAGLASHGRPGLAVVADAADPAAVADAFLKIERSPGPIDVLVNNAARVAPSVPPPASTRRIGPPRLPSISSGPSRASKRSCRECLPADGDAL